MKNQPIKVFEHELLSYKDNSFGFKEDHWKVLSDFNDRNENKYFSITASGVRFSQYVGVIQINNLIIEILPKIEKNIDFDSKDRWHQNLLSMLKVCRKIKSETLTDAHLKLRSNSILDWYIEIFVEEVRKLIHEGLIKRYRRQEDNLKTLKGRLKIVKHLRKNIIHKERFFIEANTYDSNNHLNQIIHKTLHLIKSLYINPTIASNLNNILLCFPEVSEKAINLKTFEKIKFDRKSERYRRAIDIAKLLLLNYSPDIRHGQNNLIALLFDMNTLWEEYITILIQRACSTDWQIFPQKKHLFWNSFDYNSKRLQPDIMLKSKKNKHKIIIDTKWKILENKGPSEEDLRQIYAYGNFYDARKVFLMYPASKRSKFDAGMFNNISYWDNNLIENYQAGLMGINILDNEGGLNYKIGEEIVQYLEKLN
jgi:5-methylcytosine-specific restriction enzyme subunit McrC